MNELLRQHQGRSRGAAGPRSDLPGRGAAHGAGRRLAAHGVPHAGPAAVLRRAPTSRPQDRYGLPGFPQLLEALHEAWENERDEVQRQAAQLRGGARRAAPPTGWRRAPAASCTAADLRRAWAQRMLRRRSTAVHGGFGGAPKFPNPMDVALLLRALAARRRRRRCSDAARLTLEQMARAASTTSSAAASIATRSTSAGSCRTSRRCSTTTRSSLRLYAEAQQVEPRPLWRKVAEETVAYVRARDDGRARAASTRRRTPTARARRGSSSSGRPEEVRQALPAASRRSW